MGENLNSTRIQNNFDFTAVKILFAMVAISLASAIAGASPRVDF